MKLEDYIDFIMVGDISRCKREIDEYTKPKEPENVINNSVDGFLIDVKKIIDKMIELGV